MNRREKRIVAILGIIAISQAVVPMSSAMHIMEGYLPLTFCIAWGALCLPFLAAGFLSLKRKINENRRILTMVAMSGAFIFVISSLKIPSVTGSCSHMTGTGLGAILLGPSAISVLGIIVLLFQAILLAHGGLTTLGANAFSMTIVGPFVTFGVYKLCKKINLNKKMSIFLAAALGDLLTYCVTSVQLAMAYPSEVGGIGASILKFLAVFAPTQIPLAILEGILTVLILMMLETYAKPELRFVGYFKEDK